MSKQKPDDTEIFEAIVAAAIESVISLQEYASHVHIGQSTWRVFGTSSPDYLAERGTPTHPKDLVDHDCLSFPDWTEGPRWSFLGPEGEVHVHIKSRLQINNGFGIRYAALAGAGIVMQRAELVAEDIAAGRLQALLSNYKTQSRPRHLVWQRHRRMPPKLRAFIDFIAEVYG